MFAAASPAAPLRGFEAAAQQLAGMIPIVRIDTPADVRHTVLLLRTYDDPVCLLCVYVCMYVWMYGCMYVCVCMYVCMYVCVGRLQQVSSA